MKRISLYLTAKRSCGGDQRLRGLRTSQNTKNPKGLGFRMSGLGVRRSPPDPRFEGGEPRPAPAKGLRKSDFWGRGWAEGLRRINSSRGSIGEARQGSSRKSCVSLALAGLMSKGPGATVPFVSGTNNSYVSWHVVEPCRLSEPTCVFEAPQGFSAAASEKSFIRLGIF